MPVSREEVVTAYRLMLGRDPENEAVVDGRLTHANLDALRHEFLRSEEFIRSANLQLVGRNFASEQPFVESRCTPRQMAEILARVTRVWREYGETEPYWSVLTSDDFKIESIDETLEHFYRTGLDSAQLVLHALRRNGIDPARLRTCLDVGCGVGRITFGLATCFAEVTGLDISASHLRQARERAQAVGVGNARFLQYGSVDELKDLPEFDLLVSLIVLQHNPPPVIRQMLSQLLRRVSPGGAAVFQVPTYIRGYSFSVEKYLEAERIPIMEMNALPQQDVYAVLRETGCELLEVREDVFTGSADIVSQLFTVRKARRSRAR